MNSDLLDREMDIYGHLHHEFIPARSTLRQMDTVVIRDLFDPWPSYTILYTVFRYVLVL